MGFLSRFTKEIPPTVDRNAAINEVASPDAEKQNVAQFEDGQHVPGDDPHHVYMSREIEQRVLKKLDRRLVPLVMGLCKYKYSPSSRRLILTIIPRSSRVP